MSESPIAVKALKVPLYSFNLRQHMSTCVIQSMFGPTSRIILTFGMNLHARTLGRNMLLRALLFLFVAVTKLSHGLQQLLLRVLGILAYFSTEDCRDMALVLSLAGPGVALPLLVLRFVIMTIVNCFQLILSYFKTGLTPSSQNFLQNAENVFLYRCLSAGNILVL
jgi:hypothetical protein